MKAISAEVCEFKKKVVELFYSACTSRVYTMKVHVLNHLLKDVRRYVDILFLSASGYEQYEVHIKKAFRGSSRRQSTGM